MLGLLKRHHLAKLGSRQEGDTIVEVLIAIAIVSLVLTGAYIVTNKNTAAMQGTQERVQAQHVAEGQIEALRAQNGLTTSGDCFDTDGNETSGPGCSSISVPGSGATYTASVQGPVAGKYTVSVTWTSLGSTKANDSSITLYYRLN